MVSRTRSIIGRFSTLVRRSTSPTDDRTRDADAARPCAGVVMSTAVAGPATIIRQPSTRPRARLGICNVDNSLLVGLPAVLPLPGACDGSTPAVSLETH